MSKLSLSKMTSSAMAIEKTSGDRLDPGPGRLWMTKELDNLDIDHMTDDDEAGYTSPGDGNSADDAPIVKFVHKMLLICHQARSLRPYTLSLTKRAYRIRFRIDGVMQSVAQRNHLLDLAAKALIAPENHVDHMDISERRKPQDGRIKLKAFQNQGYRFPGKYTSDPVGREDRTSYS